MEPPHTYLLDSELFLSWELPQGGTVSLTGEGVQRHISSATLITGKEIIYRFKPGKKGHITAAFTMPDGGVHIACFGRDSAFPRSNIKATLKMRVPEAQTGSGSLDIIMSEDPIIFSQEEAKEITSLTKFIDFLAFRLNSLSSDYWDIDHILVKYEQEH